MKYNVFVVDDEALAREGLRNCINESESFNMCGEAADGEMALTLMQDLRPDILVTDIKMPFMNGLELAQIVKKTMPWTRIIVLSGHDEFEYARKSISIGVDEYLLKPISGEKIIHELNHIIVNIEKERAKDIDNNKILEQLNSVNTLKKGRFFEELIMGVIDTAEAIRQAEQLKINLLSACYLAVLVEIPVNSADFKQYLIARDLIESILSSYTEVVYFFCSYDRLVIIIKGDDADAMRETAYVLARAIAYSLIKKLDYMVYVGIGNIFSRVCEISSSYMEAHKACKYIQLIGGGQIAGIDDIVSQSESKDFESLASSSIVEKLRHTKMKDTDELVKQYLNYVNETGKSSLLISNYVVIDMFVSAARFIKELGGNPSDVLPGFNNDQQLTALFNDSVDNLKEIIRETITKTLEFRDNSGKSKHFGTIKKAKDYILENYHDSAISLHSVAKEVAVSPNYFSTIFSQESGETFIEYLTDVRMKKSKELLVNTKMTLADIAIKVGYSEPHYFNYLFKKSAGLSPGAYRNKHK